MGLLRGSSGSQRSPNSRAAAAGPVNLKRSALGGFRPVPDRSRTRVVPDTRATASADRFRCFTVGRCERFRDYDHETQKLSRRASSTSTLGIPSRIVGRPRKRFRLLWTYSARSMRLGEGWHRAGPSRKGLFRRLLEVRVEDGVVPWLQKPANTKGHRDSGGPMTPSAQFNHRD